jgi:pimeloyl-ACP methyl ester carboxylesterase
LAEAKPKEFSSQARVRAEISAQTIHRGTWIRIAGPISAVGLGILAAALYFHPVGVLRWMQTTRLGWSGVSSNEVALNDAVMTYFSTNGYVDQTPVVMIHGLGPSAALEWREVMAPIAQAHYKVIAPNLMGFGPSEHKQTNYTIASQAAALGELIDTLKLEHVNLVGRDIGADIALYYAVDHPDKVERLMLVSGGLMGARGAASLRNAYIPTTTAELRSQAEISFYGVPPLPDFMYQRMMQDVAGDLPTQSSMISSIVPDEAHIRSKLGNIFNTLAVIVWGGNDKVLSPAYAEAIRDLLPGSATAIFKTSGHNPQLEHPDDFNDTVEFFLKQTEGGR